MEPQEKENPKNDLKEKSSKQPEKVDKYAKYMGAGFQIIAPVILGVLLGMWLDKKFGTTNSMYTIILSSVMIVVALYLFIRQFFKN